MFGDKEDLDSIHSTFNEIILDWMTDRETKTLLTLGDKGNNCQMEQTVLNLIGQCSDTKSVFI